MVMCKRCSKSDFKYDLNLAMLENNGCASIIVSYSDCKKFISILNEMSIELDRECCSLLEDDIKTAITYNYNMMITIYGNKTMMVEPIVYPNKINAFADMTYFIEIKATDDYAIASPRISFEIVE